MATSHIAHDCVVGDNAIIVNGCAIGGHVEIGDYAIIGGLSAVHQFSRIGKHVITAGGSLVRKDIPPYVKVGGEPPVYAGINSVGLRRRGISNENIEREVLSTPERDEILQFIQSSQRGIIRGGGAKKEEDNQD